MALQIRRGTEAQRAVLTGVDGELLYTTDTKKLYVGDGVTAGGTEVAGAEAAGQTGAEIKSLYEAEPNAFTDTKNTKLDGIETGATATPALPGRNVIINGSFDIWQRGTSFSNPSNTYTADRFLVVPGGGTTGDTVSQQTFTPGQTDVPGEPTYFLRFAAGATSGNRMVHQRVEDVRTFAGQTCTLSFYAKASVAHSSSVEFGQNFGSGGSSTVVPSAVSYTMSTSWQKFTFTITLPSIAGKTIGTSSYLYIAVLRSLGASSVSIDIAQVQLEKGPTATEFERRFFAEELELCKRYFERKLGNSAQVLGQGNTSSNVVAEIVVEYSEKRATPTGSVSSATGFQVRSGAGLVTTTNITFQQGGLKSITAASFVAGGLTVGYNSALRSIGTSNYINLDAEL